MPVLRKKTSLKGHDNSHEIVKKNLQLLNNNKIILMPLSKKWMKAEVLLADRRKLVVTTHALFIIWIRVDQMHGFNSKATVLVPLT